MTRNWKFPLALTAIVAGVLLGLVSLVHSIGTWPPPEAPPRQGEALDPEAYAMGRYLHAHAALSRTIREPFNTWTNLAFVLIGGLYWRNREPAARQAGLALVALGIGSFLYHASASRALRNLDVAAMYWVYGCLLLLAAGSIWNRITASLRKSTFAWAIGLPVVAILAALGRNLKIVGWKPLELTLVTGITALVTGAAMVAVARRSGRWTQAVSALGLFGVAVTLQIGDRPGGWLCRPGAVVQAHGLWHVVAAIACGLSIEQLLRAWSEDSSSRLVSRPSAQNLDSP